jgi:ABC-type transport system substrate-binding protein
MGMEAEVDGFDPTQNRMDVTGLTYGSLVYDPLGTYGKDGQVHPYLAQSIDHNADYTQWTVKLRPNIKFSNGDPLTADAVVADWQAHQKSPLTSPAILNLKTAPTPHHAADALAVAICHALAPRLLRATG